MFDQLDHRRCNVAPDGAEQLLFLDKAIDVTSLTGLDRRCSISSIIVAAMPLLTELNICFYCVKL
jgi:hypothetical protein